MTVVSTPACSRRIAAVCRRTCGVTSWPAATGRSGGGGGVLGEAAFEASRLSGGRVRVGNSGVVGLAGALASQARRTATVCVVSGVMRSLRPLPWQLTWAPVPRCTSARVRPISSETRSPVWTASSSRAWSRRPVQVVRSGAASSASISGSVRSVTMRRSKRLVGSPGPAGSRRRARGGAARRSGTASGSRPGGRCGCGRCCRARVSRWSRNAPISGASRSARSSVEGGLPVRAAAKPSSSRERVAVGGDGVRAGAALADQPVGEERLQGRGERGSSPRPARCARAVRRRARAVPGRPTGTSRCCAGVDVAEVGRQQRQPGLDVRAVRGSQSSSVSTAKAVRRSCMPGPARPASAARARPCATSRWNVWWTLQ